MRNATRPRLISFPSLLAVLALVLAACSSAPPAAPTSAPAAPTAVPAAPTSAPAAAAPTRAPAAAATSAPAQAAATTAPVAATSAPAAAPTTAAAGPAPTAAPGATPAGALPATVFGIEPGVGGDGSFDRVKQNGIKLGITNDQPYNWHPEGSQERKGIDYDIISEAMKRLGIDKIEFVEGPWESMVPGLQSGRFDVLVTNIHKTEARVKVIDFTTPVYFYSDWLVVQKGNPKNLHKWEDLKGHSVGAIRGENYVDWLNKRGDLAEVKTYKTFDEEIADLAAGRVDAVIGDEPVYAWYLKQHPDYPIEIVPDYVPQSSLSDYTRFGIRKGDNDLNNMLSRTLDEMRADGTLLKILKTYGLTERALSLMPPEGHPAAAPGPQAPSPTGKSSVGGDGSYDRVKNGIKLGITNDQPYNWHPEGSSDRKGIDYDIMMEALKRIGITNIEFVEGPWESMVPGLQSGRFDVLVTNIHKTEARVKVIDFTTPVYFYSDWLVVQKGNPKNLHKWEDLKGHSVGAIRGENYVDWLNKRGDLAEVKTYKTFDEEIADLAAGRVDAVIGDEPVYAWYLKQHPDYPIEIVPDYVPQSSLSDYTRFGIRKGDNDLNNMLSRTLDEMRADGTLLQLLQRYGLTQRALTLMPQLG